VDLIDVKDNNFGTVSLARLLSEKLDVNIAYIGVKDIETETRMQEKGVRARNTGSSLLTRCSPILLSRDGEKDIEDPGEEYDYPVDIEFTVNFEEGGNSN